MEPSASLITGHPFSYKTIRASNVAFVRFARATGSSLRCPETTRQSTGIVLDPAPLISQSKKGFPVSELRARQDAVGVCATFPFSRNPNVLRYQVGEGRSGSPRPTGPDLTHADPCQGT